MVRIPFPKRRISQAFLGLGIILLILLGGMFVYLNNYYLPDARAIREAESTLWKQTSYGYMGSNPAAKLEEMQTGSNYEDKDRANSKNKTSLVFYPGAKVDERSYLPFLRRIVDGGLEVHVMKMPWRMAFLDISAADKVIAQTEENSIILMGHSLGGAMASRYAANNPDKVKGLILLGAYPYGEYNGPTLSLAGSLESSVIKKNQVSKVEKLQFVIIPGANHAQFGNYGRQSGDPEAQISREEQQQKASGLILDFVQNLK